MSWKVTLTQLATAVSLHHKKTFSISTSSSVDFAGESSDVRAPRKKEKKLEGEFIALEREFKDEKLQWNLMS